MFTLAPAETYCAFFPFWVGDVRVKRRFDTTIVVVEGGKEQRSAIHETPSHGLSYNIITKNQAQTTYLKRRLNKYVNKVWAAPMWPYEMELTAAASVGTDTLHVNSAFCRELKNKIGLSGENIDVILVKDYNTVESGEIVSFDETTIVLNKNLDITWEQGAKVYPLLKATLGTVAHLESPTLEHSMVSVDFAESFRSTYEV